MDMQTVVTWLLSKLSMFGWNKATNELVATGLILGGIFLGGVIITLIVRRTLLRLVTLWIQRNQYRWDDPLASHRLLAKISWFVPITLFSLAVDSLLAKGNPTYLLLKRLSAAGFVLVAVLCLNALLSSINDIHRILRKQKGSTLRGYTDAGKIITFILGIIFLISIFTGKSPWGVLSVLGGLTAVTMLMFKDTLLGFVASVQLTTTDMVRIGDWIEMNQYGADGEVIDIAINCIRVQNWDKTITTIPTYALVSSSFKNWRGMSESGGRRIKRALLIDVSSIHFCSDALLARFAQCHLLADYLEKKKEDIATDSRWPGTAEGYMLNGRRQTNIGVFRAYITAYLQANPLINANMTFLVRQLQPTCQGLPLEIYVFSKDTSWAPFEAIQADIFDHLLAAISEFELRLFQYPSGADLRELRLPTQPRSPIPDES